MSRNEEVAALFEEYADLVEAQDVQYKPQAYRRAADNIREYPEDIEEFAAMDPTQSGKSHRWVTRLRVRSSNTSRRAKSRNSKKSAKSYPFKWWN